MPQDSIPRFQRPGFTTNTMDSTESTISGPYLGAPTPFNTQIATDAFGSTTFDEESVQGVWADDQGDIPIDHSPQASASSTTSPYPYSSHGDPLLGSLSSRPSIASVPHSTRPVPAPPLSLRFSNTNANTSSDRTTLAALSPSGPPAPYTQRPGSGSGSGPLDLSDSEQGTGPLFERRRRPSTLAGTQEEVDAKRLQQLGYDPVLGREYTFWSSLSISTVNIGALQVCSFIRAVFHSDIFYRASYSVSTACTAMVVP